MNAAVTWGMLKEQEEGPDESRGNEHRSLSSYSFVARSVVGSVMK